MSGKRGDWNNKLRTKRKKENKLYVLELNNKRWKTFHGNGSYSSIKSYIA